MRTGVVAVVLVLSAAAVSGVATSCRGPVASMTDRFFATVMTKDRAGMLALLATNFTGEMANHRCRSGVGREEFVDVLMAELATHGTDMVTPLVQLEAGRWGVAYAAWATSIARGSNSSDRVFVFGKAFHVVRLSEDLTHIDKFVELYAVEDPAGFVPPQANQSRTFAVLDTWAAAIEAKNLTAMDALFAPSMRTTQAVCMQPRAVTLNKTEFLAGQRAQFARQRSAGVSVRFRAAQCDWMAAWVQTQQAWAGGGGEMVLQDVSVVRLDGGFQVAEWYEFAQVFGPML